MGARTPADDPWAAATWEGAEAASLDLGRRLSLAARLLWLEETTRALRAMNDRSLGAKEVAGAPDAGPSAARRRG